MHGLRFGFGRRVPLVLQSEAAECGLACLAMVAGAHGQGIGLPELRRRFPLSLKGATLADLVRVAGSLQFQPRALRADLQHLAQLSMPCVLHWDLNHFVVLVSLRRGVGVIHDPARGERKVTMEELSKHFTGVALELTPTADFKPHRPEAPVRLSRLLGSVSGLKRSLAQVFVLAATLEAFVLLSPFFMQWVVDDVLLSADRDMLGVLGVGFGLLVLIQAATASLRAWAVLHLSTTLNLQWLGNVFAHLLRLPVSWFERRYLGDVWSRFAAVHHIQKTLTTSFVEAVLDGVMVTVTLVMMVIYSPTLAAIGLGCVVVYALVRWACFAPMRDATQEALVREARQSGHFLESLRGVPSIKLLNAEGARHSRYMSLVVETTNVELAVQRYGIGLTVAHRLIFGLERVAVIWVGALLVMDQRLSVGMLFAFFAYKEQFAQRVSTLIDRCADLGMLRVQAERLADIVHADAEQDERAIGAAMPPGVPVLEMRDVTFAYAEGDVPVLRGVSLRVEPGECLAIVGPSGCGKSTLLKVMLGLNEPTSGEIRVAGQPMARLGRGAWRDMIGAVLQDEPLFAGSVADNISFFAAESDDAWIIECARRACVHDEIDALPMGYHTLVGDMGTALSGGQKQRILLARALYRRPRILFLDEATSALDVEAERRVNQAIRELSITRVIVAHRPETIASASRVLALHEGRVAQDLRAIVGSGPLAPHGP